MRSAIQIASLTFMVPLGIGQAGTVRVGARLRRRRPWRHRACRSDGAHPLDRLHDADGTRSCSSCRKLLVRPFLDAEKPGCRGGGGARHAFPGLRRDLPDRRRRAGRGREHPARARRHAGPDDARRESAIGAIGLAPSSATLGLWTPLAGSGIWIGLAIRLAVVAVLMLWRWRQREQLGLMKLVTSKLGGSPPGSSSDKLTFRNIAGERVVRARVSMSRNASSVRIDGGGA